MTRNIIRGHKVWYNKLTVCIKRWKSVKCTEFLAFW